MEIFSCGLGLSARCFRACIALAVVTIFGPGLSLAAQTQAPPADQASMVRIEIAMLTFIGGDAPLTESERQRAAQIVALAMRTEPQRWTQLDRNSQSLLQRLAQHDPVYTASMRETLRANAAFPAAGDAPAQQESAIIAAHDPPIAADPAHHLVVSEQTVLAVQRADELVAARLQTRPPAAGFTAVEREQIRSGFAHWDEKTRDSYAHAPRNGAATEVFLTRFTNPQKIAPYFTQVRQQVLSHPQQQDQALTTYAVTQLLPAGYTVYQQHMARGGGAGAEALQLRWMRVKGMQQAVMCSPDASAGLCSPLP